MTKGKVKEDTILLFDKNLSAKIISLNSDGSRVVEFYHNNNAISFDYQTLFAKYDGSVAAPTASLHFTPKLLQELQNQFETHTLTLHVGAGTFKPVEAEDIMKHPMHSEYYNIPKDAQSVINSNKKILAVGTTVTRTIEYYIRTKKLNGECDLFLHPHNKPIRVDYLLTNFHLPKSTLIMLVSAFLGRVQTLKLYNTAIENGYRFYSYGDAMLII